MSLRFRSEALQAPLVGPGPTFTRTYASGTDTVVPAVAGQKIGIYRLVLQGVAITTFQFIDSIAGPNLPLSGTYALSAGGLFILDTPINMDPWWQTQSGAALQMIVGAGAIVADLWYLQTP